MTGVGRASGMRVSAPAGWCAAGGVSDLRSAPAGDAVQPDLFSGTQVVQRTLVGSGTRVRLRLTPLGGGRVRVEEAYRRGAGAARYEPWPEETGRDTELARLRLGVSYEELFGG